ncbi:MAG: winged helix-turn-helix transcriptional regulator [Tissierellia bacterium]|nr:winged helix-turn-helix transcriptional regulator [Tissierellia bacterium]
MTRREKEVLDLIKTNPMISQNELAASLGISRSSVAVHISSLTKKGLLRGRAYILGHEPGVIVIGGCNLDMEGRSLGRLKLGDSNPGIFTTTPGGVARNIAENLAEMDLSVKLITALGRDDGGQMLKSNGEEAGIDMDHVLYSETPSSVYLSVHDEQGEMVVAINQMEIIKELKRDFLQKKDELIKQANLLVMDANLEEETIDHLCRTYQDKMIFVDLVSAAKAKKIKRSLPYIYAMKPNLIEMEALVGRELINLEDYKSALKELLELGVKEIYLTLGAEGVLVATNSRLIKVSAQVDNIKSVTGAGDAFLSGAIYSSLKGWKLERLASFSQAAALLTLENEKASGLLKEDRIEKRRKDVEVEILSW